MSVYINEKDGTWDTWTTDFYKCPECGYAGIIEGNMCCPCCCEKIIWEGEEE